MIEALLIIVVVLLVVNLLISATYINSGNGRYIKNLKIKIDEFEKELSKMEGYIKDESGRNREELNKNFRCTREEYAVSQKGFQDSVLNSMTQISSLQKSQLDIFSNRIENLTKSNNESLNNMSRIIEIRLKTIQDDNNIKLEKMRETVDEKLHKTLEQRLGESFNLVSQRLEAVQKGLGEMHTLANGVGDLKRVLTNVKTRGTLGEVQLGNILAQILSPEQYSTNVAIKKGSRENVEFAIKLPGKDETEGIVYLPIDSKFPLENYYLLVDAYDKGDQAAAEAAVKLIENNIKKCARDIRDKYLDPPNSTDFGIMFLPIEGLYAEVVRRTNLIEILQREYKIIVAGPTTFAALLNSLQMGFRTLAIEKHSSEVWKVLGAIKTEFEKFGGVLIKAQEKLNLASEDIDNLVGVRTRQIQKKLKEVQIVTPEESEKYLNDISDDINEKVV